MKQSILSIRAFISTLILFACLVRSEPNVGDVVHGFEPQLFTNRYGVSSVTVVSNGFLFIDRKYVPAPYCIERVGQGIVVNGILVNNLFIGDPDETENANANWRSPRHGFRANTPRGVSTSLKCPLQVVVVIDNKAVRGGGRRRRLLHEAIEEQAA